MKNRKPRIAIVGAGIGGLAAAWALRHVGVEADIYEQAGGFRRVGAGIQQAPNAIKALRAMGLEERLRRVAFRPTVALNREWRGGEITNGYALGDEVEARYGAPYLLLHRGDLHELLASVVPSETIHLNRILAGFDQDKAGVTLSFADGTSAHADAIIGADGVHSVVRAILLGREKPHFTGRVAYRTTFPSARLGELKLDGNTKWWGPDRHIVIYFVKPRREEIYFVTSTPEPDFAVESWSAKGDLRTLREAYSGFHSDVRAVLDACPEVHKWALVEREPLPRWGEGRAVLLGDACHPMTPYMAQGASTAIEDAVVLARCLATVDTDGIECAFRRYELTRKERTTKIQMTSRMNTWMRYPTDADWVYGYDAWTAPLAE